MPMDEGRRELFTPAEAAEHTSLTLLHAPEGGAEQGVFSVVSDSRDAEEGALFVALAGEKTDGHRFLDDVAAAGSAAVLVSAEFSRRAGSEAYLRQLGPAVLVAEDPLSGLQELAAWWVERHPECTRIGVTGSNGKTTTKEIIAAILSRDRKTVWNEGNYNSEIGLPLSVFNIAPHHRYGVFEMGMNRKGEMAILSQVLRPRYMVLTMIGSAHIGLLGSREAIAEEKARPFVDLPADGAGFLPEECPWAERFTPRSGAPLYRFGPQHVEGYGSAESLGLEGWLIELNGRKARFPLVGEHNLHNALAAVRLARFLGISWETIRHGLEEVQPVWGRSVISRGAVTIVEDSYNANIESMTAMLHWLAAAASGRLICVLGAMKELGSETEEAHRQLGRAVAETSPDAVFFFGEETDAALEEVRKAGFPGRSAAYTAYEKLERAVVDSVETGDTVLLKGSRSMELERLVQPIRKMTEQKGSAQQTAGGSA